MKLIDKSALVAEIKRLLAFYSKEIEDNKESPWAMDIAKRDILQEILSFVNTLEVKDVNFDKELSEVWRNWANEYDISFVSYKKIAKHFFELGMQVSNKQIK